MIARVPLVARILLVGARAAALAVGRSRFRRSREAADEARRVGAVPAPFRTVGMYRGAAVVTALVGAIFVVLGLFAGW